MSRMKSIPKLPMVDMDKKTCPQVYQDVNNWINEYVAGKTFSDRLLNMAKFYQRYYNKSPLETIGDDVNFWADKMADRIIDKMDK